MSRRSLGVVLGIARRGARRAIKNPAFAFSPMAVPLFMFAAFAGALSSLGTTPGFDYYNYTAFIFVFVLYEACVFVGIFTGVDMAADFGGGLGDRFMLAAPKRLAIVAGYVLFMLGRALLAIAVVWGVAVATGMPVRGPALEIAGIVALALMLATATMLWAAGLSLRMRSPEAAALIFLPSFLVLFLTPAFVPRHLLTSWLHTAADINPVTPAMEAGRNFMAHTHAHVGLAFGATAALVVAFSFWAVRGMRAAERGPRAPRAPGAGGPAARRREMAARVRARRGSAGRRARRAHATSR